MPTLWPLAIPSSDMMSFSWLLRFWPSGCTESRSETLASNVDAKFDRRNLRLARDCFAMWCSKTRRTATGGDIRAARERTFNEVVERVEETLEAAEDALPPGFPMPIFDAIKKGMTGQAHICLDSKAGRA